MSENVTWPDYSWVLALPRGVGHTAAACGQPSPGRIVVVGTLSEAERQRKRYGVRAVHLGEAATALLGSQAPVVFNLGAVREVVLTYQAEVDRLRAEIASLRKVRFHVELTASECVSLQRTFGDGGTRIRLRSGKTIDVAEPMDVVQAMLKAADGREREELC